MLYALICTDKASHQDVRRENRPAHVAWLEELGSNLKAAGPFVDESKTPTGSLIILEAESLDAVRALADEDPYAQAGLFHSVEIRPWNWLIKNPEDD